MLTDVNLWPLIGVAIIVAGFVLRFNPMLVVIVTAIGTALAAGFPVDKVLATIGTGFIKTRNLPLIILLPLAVIGLLERHGLRQHAQNWISSIKSATAGRLLIVYLAARQLTAAVGLTSLGGHPQMVRLAGLSRGEPDPSAETGARYYNSLFALHDEGAAGLRIGPIYDKHRLVPFGEYLPLGDLMSKIGVRSLVHVPADFSAGPAPAPISLVNAPSVQPLICYEALYPGFTPATAATRPAWIVNVSNDAWFGKTSGPRQHLNLASYRALETGLPVARATPTGVSAMIDPWGRIVEGRRLDPGQAGIIDVRLPQPAPPTLYGRWGDLGFAILMVIMLTAGRRRAGNTGADR